MTDYLPPTTDVVFIDTLRLSANIGYDCWGRRRAQPIELTVYLHLKNSYLQAASQSDNVLDSIHYGHLSKAISTLAKSKSENGDPGFDGIDGLIGEVAQEALKLAGNAADEVRVVVDIPKLILLAGGFAVDYTIPHPSYPLSSPGAKKVYVKELILPVIIGVNPPERESKQRVITSITFYERKGLGGIEPVDYQKIVCDLTKVCRQLYRRCLPTSHLLWKELEASSYMTLEKFVMHVVRSGCLSSEAIEAVTARAQKPSALSFAHSSGVEITRARSVFLV
jgi:dihydroneopterin aldolase